MGAHVPLRYWPTDEHQSATASTRPSSDHPNRILFLLPLLLRPQPHRRKADHHSPAASFRLLNNAHAQRATRRRKDMRNNPEGEGPAGCGERTEIRCVLCVVYLIEEPTIEERARKERRVVRQHGVWPSSFDTEFLHKYRGFLR